MVFKSFPLTGKVHLVRKSRRFVIVLAILTIFMTMVTAASMRYDVRETSRTDPLGSFTLEVHAFIEFRV